jgi:CBS domain-containing protein
MRSQADPTGRSVAGMSEKPHGQLVTFEGSYLTPSWERARVGDAMRTGVISCPPDTAMDTVARIMATNHVHAIVVLGGNAPWRVVTDADVLRVASDAADHLAGSCASDPPVMVKPSELLSAAVELMERHRVTHLLVGDPESSSPPMGVLSSLDVAGIIAWGRG